MIPYLTALDVHAGPSGASAWVATLPFARLTLVLSAGPYRAVTASGSSSVVAVLNPVNPSIATTSTP